MTCDIISIYLYIIIKHKLNAKVMNPTLKPKVHFTVHVELSEGELRALDALAGYGTDEFLTIFYRHMGEAYLKPFESDIRELFDKIKDLKPAVNDIRESRKKLGLPQIGI